MSLINQVLNDLEKRGASTNIGEATVRVVPLRRNHGALWLFVAAVSVPVLTATAWLKWGEELAFDMPSFSLATAPASVVAQPASRPEVTILASAEVAASAPGVNHKLDAIPQSATLVTKPLLILAPVISAVTPSPVTGAGLPQPVTITGSNYASDAIVVLRTPKGKVSKNLKIVKRDMSQIVVSANFRNNAGVWSVEVLNASGHSSEQLSSGQFSFTVLPVPAEASPQAQDKVALTVPKAAQSVVKPAPAATKSVLLPEGKVSKQQTHVTLQQQAESEFRNAYALMQQGQVTAAISGYEAALKLDAGHLAARQTLVRLLLDNKRNTDAERVLQEGLEFDAKQHGLAMLLARMQVGRNELAQALDTMQKSLPYAEKQADYQAFVAALLQRQNRHQEAIDYFQNAVKLNPQSGVWLMGLGISLRAEQRNDEARDVFKRALETRTLSAELQSFVKKQLQEL